MVAAVVMARAWYVKVTRRDRSWRFVAGPFDTVGEGHAETGRIRSRYPDALSFDTVLRVGRDLPEPTPRGPLDIPLPPPPPDLRLTARGAVEIVPPVVGYYVTCRRSARKVAWLAGPFDSEAEAQLHVEGARIVAGILDPWCDFDAFGTARLERAILPPGVLHALVGF